jgi:VIT1/CCC1 family predicted Fe2+/Mn2+ transporter
MRCFSIVGKNLSDEGLALKRLLKNRGARTGVFFGATSGVITTVGLIAGLYAGPESVVAVLGGIFVIAVADALSDALGIHLAEEANPESTSEHIWAATFSTFYTKFIVAISFAVPILWLPLDTAVFVSMGWGLVVIALLSCLLARAQQHPILPVVLEHLGIAIAVIIISYYIGIWVHTMFA